MSRRLDWDRAKVRLGAGTFEVSSEVPRVIGPLGARKKYLKVAVAAVAKGHPPPPPSALFLRYFTIGSPDRNIEKWLSTQPEYRAALQKRAGAKKLNRQRYLAKLADIEGSFIKPPLSPISLDEIESPETPEKIWDWARRQPEYGALLKTASRKKAPFN